MAYKIAWFDKITGDKCQIVSRFFNELLKKKRELEQSGIIVLFTRTI